MESVCFAGRTGPAKQTDSMAGNFVVRSESGGDSGERATAVTGGFIRRRAGAGLPDRSACYAERSAVIDKVGVRAWPAGLPPGRNEPLSLIKGLDRFFGLCDFFHSPVGY